MQDAEGDAVSASNPQGRSVISGVIASEREIDCGGVKLRVEKVTEFSAVMF